MKYKVLKAAIGACLWVLLFPVLSLALTVTNLLDSGPGSLRDAVANTPSGGTVDFAVTGMIELSSEIEITKDVTINGPGADALTVSGANVTRVFNVTGGMNIKVSGIRIADGFIFNDIFGGTAFLIILPSLNMELSDCVIEDNFTLSDIGVAPFGAIAILNSSPPEQLMLKINRCSFINNRVTNTSSVGTALSAVIGSGTGYIKLEVYDSLFERNVVQADVALGGVMQIGTTDNSYRFTNSTFDSNQAIGKFIQALGGVMNDGAFDNNFEFTNCTFYNNSAVCMGEGCSRGLAQGGAIHMGSESELEIDFCTFDSNSVSCPGGQCFLVSGAALFTSLDNTRLSNSIIYSDETSENCSGPILSLGYNIDNGNTCADGGNDKPFTNPNLDPRGLQDNGGPTPTIALLGTSPAIDMADPACPPPGTDQRGVVRPQLISCDIGAYEFINPSRPIPTLSEWGLIALAGILGLIGFMFIRRNRAVA